MKYFILFFLIISLAFILRIYKAADTPHDLYVDEVSIGYNAYSILKTGKDEHGKNFPIFFEAFGEYKLPVYIYLTSISEAVFGKNAFAVRFSSVIAGTLTVGILIVLVQLVSKNKRTALLSGLLLATSIWHLQFSRAGFEATVYVFLILAGTLFLIKGLPGKGVYFLLGLLTFVVSLYTYNAARIFIPLYLFGYFLIYRYIRVYVFRSKRIVMIYGILLILTIPFIRFALSPAGLARAKSESFIKDVTLDTYNYFENKIFLTGSKLIHNYTRYFSLDFLFFAGDGIGRHSLREIGLLPVWQLPMLLLGLLIASKRRQSADKLFLLFLLAAPIPAIFSTPNPHALRSIPMIVPLVYFVSVGVIGLFTLINSKLETRNSKQSLNSKEKNSKHFEHLNLFRTSNFGLRIFITFLSIYFFFSYLHMYYVHYPKRTSPDWSGGYKEAMERAYNLSNMYQKVFITKDIMQGYVYSYFYGKFDPGQVQTVKNYSGGVGKFSFVDSPYQEYGKEKILYVSPFWEDWKQGKLIKKIYNRGNDWVFSIWEN